MEGAEEWKYDYDFSSAIRVRECHILINQRKYINMFLALTHSLYDITKYLCGRLSALTPYEWGGEPIEQWDSYTQPMHLLDQTVD